MLVKNRAKQNRIAEVVRLRVYKEQHLKNNRLTDIQNIAKYHVLLAKSI